MNDIVSVHIAAWLACAVFVIMGWNALNSAIDRNKSKPPGEQLASENASLTERVDRAEKSLGELWTTMRAENTAIRTIMAEHQASIERSLGRLEGKIDTALRVLRQSSDIAT